MLPAFEIISTGQNDPGSEDLRYETLELSSTRSSYIMVRIALLLKPADGIDLAD